MSYVFQSGSQADSVYGSTDGVVTTWTQSPIVHSLSASLGVSGSEATFTEFTGSFVALGTAPASAGDVRLTNKGVINFRNAAGSNDVQSLEVDENNVVIIGGANAAGISASLGTTNVATLASAITDHLCLGVTPATTGAVRLGTSLGMVWSEGSNSPEVLVQARTSDVATSGLLIKGQDAFATATGTNRNGGNVTLQAGQSGSAGGVDGVVNILSANGAKTLASIGTSSISLGDSTNGTTSIVLGPKHNTLTVNDLTTAIGFLGTAAATIQTVTGSVSGPAALQSLVAALATYGLVVNSTGTPGAVGVTEDIQYETVASSSITTGTGLTTVAQYPIPVGNSVLRVNASFKVSKGSDQSAAAYGVISTFKRVSGTVSLVGSSSLNYSQFDFAMTALTASLTSSAATILAQIQGITGVNCKAHIFVDRGDNL